MNNKKEQKYTQTRINALTHASAHTHTHARAHTQLLIVVPGAYTKQKYAST
jgi:hypothetical protein